LAVSRAFGDRNLKSLLRSEPDIKVEDIDHTAELLVLASDGLWKVCINILKFPNGQIKIRSISMAAFLILFLLSTVAR
jgi:hypothetical protein